MSFHSIQDFSEIHVLENTEINETCSQWLGRKIEYFLIGFWDGMKKVLNYVKRMFEIIFFETGMTPQLIIHATIEMENSPKKEVRKIETLTDENVENDDAYYEGD